MIHLGIVSLLARLTLAPHAPGCLPAEGSALVGSDKGESTLSMLHELGVLSAELFRGGRVSQGISNVVSGLQRVHQVSFHCALCLASYVNCGALAGNCLELCGDFQSPQCKICVAQECGKALLACARADFQMPTDSTRTET